jgi:DNA-binding transcriptional LysR family regulator
MDLYKVGHLIALAEHGTVSKAARSANLSQPAFSRSLQSLANELGVPLTERVGRRLILTEYGRLVVDRGKRVLLEQADARRALRELAEGQAGQLAIGCAATAAAVVLPAFLGQIAREHPRVRVRVETAGTTALLELLRAEKLDAVIGDGFAMLSHPGLEIERLPDAYAALYVRPGHPILQEPVLDAATIRRWPVASPPPSVAGATMVVSAVGAEMHPERLVTITCENLALLRDLALQSDTILAASRTAMDAAVRDGTLVELPVPNREQVRTMLSIARLEGRSMTPLLTLLYACARRATQAPPTAPAPAGARSSAPRAERLAYAASERRR